MIGTITFFTGPMFCGKSERLIYMLNRHRLMKIPRVCIQPTTDTRAPQIKSRNGTQHESVHVLPTDLDAIRGAIGDARVVGIDEFHFFTPAAVALLAEFVRRGRTIYVAGLDTDFRGEPFPSAVALLSLPETAVERMRAVCTVCNQETATRSQRLVDGHPASSADETVVVEGSSTHVSYEPRCIACHVVPR